MKKPSQKPKPKHALVIRDLKADPANPNRMQAEDLARMEKSMAEFGDLSGIVLNRRTGNLIGGHQRVSVLKDCEIEAEDLAKPEQDGTVARGHILYRGRKMSLRVVDWPESKARAALLAANRFGRVGVDDAAAVKELLSELDTGEFDMDLTGYSQKVLEEMMTACPPEADDTYTRKIVAPVYEPKGDCPSIADLFDREKTAHLIAEIDGAGLPDDVASFLRLAAERHTAFHFARIAEFYCHASPQVQDLMEKSGMVIIDFKKAIEYGFVHMTERLGKLSDLEGSEEDDA